MMKCLFVLTLLFSCPFFGQATVPDSVITYHWNDLPESYNPDTIVSLSFDKLKLDSLPTKLQEFTNLRYLDLGRNKLTELPGYFVDLKQLREINLDKNRLAIFPLEICQLDSLTDLILSRNQISRVPDCIEYAEKLEYIDFYDNPIRHLPEGFERMRSLITVDFSGIRFTPDFQEKWIRRMPHVEFIFEVPCDCMK